MADKKIQIKNRNGSEWDSLFPVTKTSYVENENGETIDGLLSDKVDKVSGKGLSTNDFTTSEKTKLSNLEDHTSEITELTENPIPVGTTEPTDSNVWFEELA